MNNKLSIIIPFAGEYPQVLFTIQSIAQSLLTKDIDFEIIAVNNYCRELEEQVIQNMKYILRSSDLTNGLGPEVMLEISSKAWPKVYLEDKSGPAIAAVAGKHTWLKYAEYTNRLSHWQCKRVGVEDIAEGDTLLFIDAHCIPSGDGIYDMFEEYRTPVMTEVGYENFCYSEAGTMHLPLTYKIMEYRRLIYKMVIENGYYYYKFTGLGSHSDPFEVPVMSTCGMMINRKIYDAIGGWPKGLGIYGGGENFINYTLAVTGYKKWIYPGGVLMHHGERRDYHYLYDDQVFNRALAHYLFGGKDIMRGYLGSIKDAPQKMLDKIAEASIESGLEQRNLIKSNTKVELNEWIAKWEEADKSE